jgi:hypothetical protein
LGSKENEKASTQAGNSDKLGVFEWLQIKDDFFFNRKLSMDGEIPRVNEAIDSFEVLFTIPASAVLRNEGISQKGGTDDCKLLAALWRELYLGNDSEFSSYILHLLDKEGESSVIPARWSNIGKRLMEMTIIENYFVEYSSDVPWSSDNKEDSLDIIWSSDDKEDSLDDTFSSKDIEEEFEYSDENEDDLKLGITSWVSQYEGCFREIEMIFSEEVEDSEDSSDNTFSSGDKEEDFECSENEDSIKSFSWKTHFKGEHINGIELDNDSNLQLTEMESKHERALALMVQNRVEKSMFVPLYDQLLHHHVKANVQHVVHSDFSVSVVALTSFQPGEIMYRPTHACIHNCIEPQQHNVLDTLRAFGYVQDFPHYWHFPFGVSFIYDGRDHLNMTVSSKLTWIDYPKEDWQFELLNFELDRHRALYAKEIIPSNRTVPANEWKVIDDISNSARLSLEHVIQDLHAERGNTPYNLEEKESEIEKEEEKGGEEEQDFNDEPECYGDGTCTCLDLMTHNDDEGNDPWMINGCNSTKCDLQEIRDSRGCRDHSYTTLYNHSAFAVMRAAYIATVGPAIATITLNFNSGMQVGSKIDHSPGRGRGIFSTENIKKGTLVWRGDNTAAFDNGIHFRKFLNSLPNDMACDLIVWCYTIYDIEENRPLIECDLDEGSLINTYSTKFEYNIGCLPSMFEDSSNYCDHSIFALRDIFAGEELVTNYAEFDTDHWHYFGLSFWNDMHI